MRVKGQGLWTPEYSAQYERRYGKPYAQDMSKMVTDPKSGNRMVWTGAALAALGAGGVFGAGLAAGGAGATGTGAGALTAPAGYSSPGVYGGLFGGSAATTSAGTGAGVGMGTASGGMSMGALARSAVPAATSLATTYMGNRASSKANNAALVEQGRQFDATQAFLQAQEEQRHEEYLAAEAEKKRQFDAIEAEKLRRWQAREPWRQASRDALTRMSDLVSRGPQQVRYQPTFYYQP